MVRIYFAYFEFLIILLLFLFLYFHNKNKYQMGTTLSVVFEAQCRETLKRMDVIEKLREEKFDVYIVENADMCGMGEICMSY